MPMKTNLSNLAVVMALTLLNPLHAAAQTAAFSYQGRLTGGGNAANGSYDLRFALFDAGAGGAQIGGAATNLAVPVNKGLFTVSLDFGANAFNGATRWLEIGVRTNGSGAFRILPRQPITAGPQALFAVIETRLEL